MVNGDKQSSRPPNARFQLSSLVALWVLSCHRWHDTGPASIHDLTSSSSALSSAVDTLTRVYQLQQNGKWRSRRPDLHKFSFVIHLPSMRSSPTNTMFSTLSSSSDSPSSTSSRMTHTSIHLIKIPLANQNCLVSAVSASSSLSSSTSPSPFESKHYHPPQIPRPHRQESAVVSSRQTRLPDDKRSTIIYNLSVVALLLQSQRHPLYHTPRCFHWHIIPPLLLIPSMSMLLDSNDAYILLHLHYNAQPMRLPFLRFFVPLICQDIAMMASLRRPTRWNSNGQQVYSHELQQKIHTHYHKPHASLTQFTTTKRVLQATSIVKWTQME